MMHEIAVEAGKSLWREIGEEVLKKGATAVIVEGTKAFVDVLKRRRIRRDEWEFQQWKKSQEPEEEDDEKSDSGEKDDSERDEENDSSDDSSEEEKVDDRKDDEADEKDPEEDPEEDPEDT